MSADDVMNKSTEGNTLQQNPVLKICDIAKLDRPVQHHPFPDETRVSQERTQPGLTLGGLAEMLNAAEVRRAITMLVFLLGVTNDSTLIPKHPTARPSLSGPRLYFVPERIG